MPIMDLCLAAKRRPDPRAENMWWEQEVFDLVGMWTEAREAGQTEEETDGTGTGMETETDTGE